MNVYQHLDELKDSDGVGNDAIGLHHQFLSLGWKSNFITRIPRVGSSIDGSHFYQTTDIIKFQSSDLHILHYGGHGYPIKVFIDAPGKKILRFHNVTPASFYNQTTSPEIFNSMLRFESVSYLEIATLSIICDAAWCDSPFNAYTIQSFDFKKLFVLPICKKYSIKPRLTKGKTNFDLCFVGRFAPQKKWEDLIDFFSNWHQVYPQSNLYCVGSVIGAFDGYFERLQKRVTDHHLGSKVHFLTGQTDSQVIDVMHKSFAMVSMSEHEGFCLPLLEAFGSDLPVFAFDACAIKTTMKGAGVLFDSKDYRSLTDVIGKYTKDEQLIDKLLSKQREVIEEYNTYPWIRTLPFLVSQL